MRVDPIHIALAFHCVTEVDWFSSSGFDDFVAYDFDTGTVQGYLAEQIA